MKCPELFCCQESLNGRRQERDQELTVNYLSIFNYYRRYWNGLERLDYSTSRNTQVWVCVMMMQKVCSQNITNF